MHSSLFVLVTLTQAAYYYADIVAFLFHQCCQQVVMCMHIHDTSTLSFAALDRLVSMGVPWGQLVVKVHGVGEALCQGLVNVQSRKPPEVVSTTADVLDENELKEEATQLRGWLVCQSFTRQVTALTVLLNSLAC